MEEKKKRESTVREVVDFRAGIGGKKQYIVSLSGAFDEM